MRTSKLVFPGVTMIAVTYGLARFSYGLLLPNISHDLAMSSSVSGIISSLFYLSYCFAIVVSIVLTVDKGPRVMVLVAGVFAIVGLVIMGVSPNVWLLGFGVLLAGASTGFASPPYGAAITLWITEHKQGDANTWINSGTSIGLVLSGIGTIFLASEWRFTYLIYACIGLIALVWNAKILPRADHSHVTFKKGRFSFRNIKGAEPLIICSTMLGISTAVFWTFAIDFLESTGRYQAWQLPLFWVILGVFGLLGGFSGSLIKRFGLPVAYKWGSFIMSAASFLMAWHPEEWSIVYLAAALFGVTYIFITGLLLVWGIKVFITNASLGIGTPFLLLAVGQVIGSIVAGVIVDLVGFAPTFAIYGLIGVISILLGPKYTKYKCDQTPNYEPLSTSTP